MIGADIEKVRRFRLKRTDPFLCRNFTKAELSYCFSHTRPEIHLAGIFCAKESALKTMSGSIDMSSMEVRHFRGRPVLFVTGKKSKIDISISHTMDDAIAVAWSTAHG